MSLADTESENNNCRGSSRSTDGRGIATARFTSGTALQAYQITAEADLGGHALAASTTVQTLPLLKIAYAWQQTNLDWHESGSTSWPFP